MQYENLGKAVAVEWDTLENIINYELEKVLDKKICVKLEREDTEFQIILKGNIEEDMQKITATFEKGEYEVQEEEEIWLENDFSKLVAQKCIEKQTGLKAKSTLALYDKIVFFEKESYFHSMY